MKNSEILQKVANHELSSSDAVDAVLQADREAQDRLRPKWMPLLLWAAIIAVFGVFLVACGADR